MTWQNLSLIILRDQTYPELHAQWLARAQGDLPDVHAKRREQWASGRVALTKAFSERGVNLDPENCDFEGHQEIRQFPDWRFSLSNTEGFAAALLAPKLQGHSIGLDIERLSRKMSEGVAQRMRHSGDVGLTDLELWCVKEAAYKTLPIEVQEKIWLNSIQVLEASFKVNDLVVGSWRREAHAELLVIQAQAT